MLKKPAISTRLLRAETRFSPGGVLASLQETVKREA
jgi:hypothetical protein